MKSALKDIYLGKSMTMKRTFTQEEVERCAELTGDDNPMYLDDDFARQTRFGRTIVQGILTEGLVTALMNRYIPGPGALLLEKELVFFHPVYVGEEITAYIEVIDMDEDRHWITEKVVCTDPRGQEVMRGQFVLLVQTEDEG